LLIVKPFEKSKDNPINSFNEIAITMTFVLVLIINNIELSEGSVNVMGWILIAPLILSLIFTWIAIVPDIVKGFKESLRKFFKKQAVSSKDEEVNVKKEKRTRFKLDDHKKIFGGS